MRRSIIAALFASFCAVCSPCLADSSTPGGSHWFRFNGTPVAVLAPNDVEITPRKNLPDFDVYDFGPIGKEFLSAYVGNQPDFHMLSNHKEVVVAHRKADGMAFTDIRYETTERGATRELLVKLPGSEPWASYIHFFYEDDSPEQAKLADQIIASLRRNPHK